MSATAPNARTVRRYHVFRGRTPVLGVEGRPGRLYSMAHLPEGATAPEHPWLDGVSHDPAHEHALRLVLLASADFDDFLGRLVAAGFDVAADHGTGVRAIIGPPLRLSESASDGERTVGALWRCEGQLSSLGWQPELGELTYAHGLATAYLPDALPRMWRALEASASFEELLAALALNGYTPAAGAST